MIPYCIRHRAHPGGWSKAWLPTSGIQFKLRLPAVNHEMRTTDKDCSRFPGKLGWVGAPSPKWELSRAVKYKESPPILTEHLPRTAVLSTYQESHSAYQWRLRGSHCHPILEIQKQVQRLADLPKVPLRGLCPKADMPRPRTPGDHTASPLGIPCLFGLKYGGGGTSHRSKFMAPWESQPLFPLKPHVCPLRFQQNYVRISIKGEHPIYLIKWKKAGAGKDSFTRTATQWKPKATEHPRNQSKKRPSPLHTHEKPKQNKKHLHYLIKRSIHKQERKQF